MISSLPQNNFTLLRVEHDNLKLDKSNESPHIKLRGAAPAEIEVASGEPTTGVRLVLAYGNGTINGEVKVRNGSLPEGTHVTARITRSGAPLRRISSAKADSKGHFVMGDIPPGEYELTVRALPPDGPGLMNKWLRPSKELITVKKGTTTRVVIVVDLSQAREIKNRTAILQTN